MSCLHALALLALFLGGGISVASADAPGCGVVKLLFTSDDKADSATNTFARQILTDEGYRIVDDWLFTLFSHSDYSVKIIINHTQVPNYGFPVSLMGLQLYIADGSGTILVNNYIDRSNLEGSLRAFIPACNAPQQSGPNDDQEVNAK